MSDKPPGTGWIAVPKSKAGGFKRASSAGRWEYWYPGDQPSAGKDFVPVELEGYNLKVVSSDIKRAQDVAKKIKAGIDRNADICKMRPEVCRKNLGITRDNMPQIMDQPISTLLQGSEEDKKKAQAAIDLGADPDEQRSIKDVMLDAMKKRGVKIEKTEIPVGELHATQAEIKAGKSYGMADSYLRGKFSPGDEEIVVSSDNHILDGHHRWAALLIADPTTKMKVIRVDMPMKEFLRESFKVPGVFRADIQGKIIDPSTKLDLKDEEKAMEKSAGCSCSNPVDLSGPDALARAKAMKPGEFGRLGRGDLVMKSENGAFEPAESTDGFDLFKSDRLVQPARFRIGAVTYDNSPPARYRVASQRLGADRPDMIEVISTDPVPDPPMTRKQGTLVPPNSGLTGRR